jgi:DNA-binding transcriptional MocR family regulator
MYLFGSNVDSNEVLITNGCQEAITLALQAVAQPGDTIAIESPTFYGLLQVIDALGMKALEIPTDPQEGISIPALTLALEQWTVKACVVIPNFSNPLGCLMTDDKKRQLVQLAHRHNMVLIEDDIYGDLGFSGERPRSLHSFDPLGKVIYCSSFSKTLSPGLRLGWMVAGAYFQPVEYLKYIANLAAPTMQQMAVAHYLEQNSYERYLRQAQSNYQRQVSLFTHAISKYFPANTRVTQPKGGFVLWVELDSKINALVLCQQALEARISIVPGQIFSASQKYQNFIRLNCAHPWTSTLEQALQYLGQLVFKLIETKDY